MNKIISLPPKKGVSFFYFAIKALSLALCITIGTTHLHVLQAQSQDSTALTIDSTLTQQDTLSKKKEKRAKFKRDIVPKKALIYSLVLPGLGQAYNRRWWKLPLVYGALGGVIYSIDFNTKQYNRLNTALNLKRQDMEHEFTGTTIDSETSLKNIRDDFDKNRQLSYIGLVVVYALQSIEAFVDAHLQNFDMDDDLSFKGIKPHFDYHLPINQPVMGLQFTLPLYKEVERKPNRAFSE